MRVPVCVQPGDTVVAGQTMALLQLGDVYTAVVAPREGIIDAVLVSDGERIDFGKPLFTLKAAER
jgi:acetyl-CoA carboxylase biotin carboxyl carrier protein